MQTQAQLFGDSSGDITANFPEEQRSPQYADIAEKYTTDPNIPVGTYGS